MSPKSGSAPIDPSAEFDDEITRPIPLQLIARLAAQDPTVSLKIGVVEAIEADAAEDSREEPDGN